jgi:hypothetical protein
MVCVKNSPGGLGTGEIIHPIERRGWFQLKPKATVIVAGSFMAMNDKKLLPASLTVPGSSDSVPGP